MKYLLLFNDSGYFLDIRKELIEKLKEEGHDVELSYPMKDKSGEETRFGCKVHDIEIDRRGTNPIKDYVLIKRYKKLLKQVKPDVVICYSIKCNIYGGYACRKLNIPYYVNITGLGSAFNHGKVLKHLVVKMYKIALKKVNKAFFENEDNRNVFVENNIIPMEKTIVLNGAGVNIQKFSYHSLEQKENVSFVFVGRIMKEKGANELFSAIEKIKSDTRYGNVSFDFYGGFEEDYVDRIKELENKNYIRYNGFVNNLNELYPQYDCLILPSYHEGMANVLLEFASIGRALITTDIPGCREAVLDGESGYLIKKADIDDLYEKIVRFIGLSYEKKLNMGLVGRKLMEEKFEKSKVVKDTVDALFGGIQ